MHSKKVFLLGPMGAGKSTIGKLLAAHFECQYFDNDIELAKMSGLSTHELSNISVEELHRLETECFTSIYSRLAPFISGAAASVIDQKSNRHLLQDVFSIYLRLPLDEVIERAGASGIGRQGVRLATPDILRQRFIHRDPLYTESSQLVINLSDSAEHDAAVVIAALSEPNVR